MSLLFDLTASQPNASGKRHGGGKYCEMLFIALCNKKVSFDAFYDSSKYINPIVVDSAQQNNIKLHDIQQQHIQDIITTQNITHLYSALPESILPWPNCKILGTIHGLRSYEMPFDFFSKWQFDNGFIGLNTFIEARRQKKIKRNILHYYQKLLDLKNFNFVTDSRHSFDTIRSIGCQKEIPVFFPPATTTNDEIRSDGNYFLMVSANRCEKNCVRAIIALDKLYSKGAISPQKKVKITGLNEPKFRYKLKNPSQFEFWGYVEEDTLSKLFANSWCFIYPSLNEGFGYPPLEAMKYGVPIIASNAASIPEVCGDAALYISPKSIKDIQRKVLEIHNSKLYATLSQKSLNQFKIISKKQQEDTEKFVNWIIFQSGL